MLRGIDLFEFMSRFLVFCFATVIIRRAQERTGKQVAVIIDEYDAPLLDVLHAQPTLDAIRKVMQELCASSNVTTVTISQRAQHLYHGKGFMGFVKQYVRILRLQQ